MDPKIYDVVLFHNPCQDGLASGWIANHYHKLNNKSIDLYPVQHGNPLDFTRLSGKKIITPIRKKYIKMNIINIYIFIIWIIIQFLRMNIFQKIMKLKHILNSKII
jgi:hypothetical protein